MDYYKDKAEVTLVWVCTRIIQCPSLFITVIILIAPPGGVKDHKWAPYSKILIYFSFETLPHKWLEIYNNKSTALPFENHLQLLIITNKTRSLEITIDVSASYIRHVVIFQANFGYAYLQCIKYFLLTNKFISVFSLQKSSFERAEQLSLSFSWRENLWKDEQIKLQTSTP